MKHCNTKITCLVAIIALCIGNAAGKTTAAGSRLIAQSRYLIVGTTFSAFDSQSYSYPSSTTTNYTQKLSYQYNTGAWLHTQKADYTYNAAGKLTNMQYQNWAASTSSYTNGGLTFYFLNSAGYCIKDSNQLWIPASSAYRDNVRNTYTLSSTGQITDKVYQYWDFGCSCLLNTYHDTYTYNSHGKVLVNLSQDWDASIHWMDHTKTTNVYNTAGTGLQTTTGEQSITFGSPLQLVYQNVYTLNTDGTIAMCLSNIWNSSTSSYRPSMRITMTYDAAGDNTLETQEQWDVPTAAYKPYQQYIRTYNTYHQMTSNTRMMWNGTAYATPNSRDNYYYEAYTAPTAVEDVDASVAQLSLAPIPATNTLHIALNWAQPQAFTVTMTDMNGRQWHSFSVDACSQYTDNINTDNMPTGNYILTIRGEQGSTLSRMVILQH